MPEEERLAYQDCISRQTSYQSQSMSTSVSRQGSVIDAPATDIRLERSQSNLDPNRQETEGNY